MAHTPKWLFFDVGSTLVDEQLAYAHRMQDIAAQAGIPCAAVSELAAAFYQQNKKGDLEAARHFGVPLPAWHTEDEILYPDAEGCLSQLHQRYKIGVIANQLPGTEARLGQHGVLQHIDLVIASAEEGVSKPDKRFFEIALERAGCRPSEAIMIGDRIDNDILPANLLGMGTVWIRQGFGRYWHITQKQEEPMYTVNTLTELCSIL